MDWNHLSEALKAIVKNIWSVQFFREDILYRCIEPSIAQVISQFMVGVVPTGYSLVMTSPYLVAPLCDNLLHRLHERGSVFRVHHRVAIPFQEKKLASISDGEFADCKVVADRASVRIHGRQPPHRRQQIPADHNLIIARR